MHLQQHAEQCTCSHMLCVDVSIVLSSLTEAMGVVSGCMTALASAGRAAERTGVRRGIMPACLLEQHIGHEQGLIVTSLVFGCALKAAAAALGTLQDAQACQRTCSFHCMPWPCSCHAVAARTAQALSGVQAHGVTVLLGYLRVVAKRRFVVSDVRDAGMQAVGAACIACYTAMLRLAPRRSWPLLHLPASALANAPHTVESKSALRCAAQADLQEPLTEGMSAFQVHDTAVNVYEHRMCDACRLARVHAICYWCSPGCLMPCQWGHQEGMWAEAGHCYAPCRGRCVTRSGAGVLLRQSRKPRYVSNSLQATLLHASPHCRAACQRHLPALRPRLVAGPLVHPGVRRCRTAAPACVFAHWRFAALCKQPTLLLGR